MMNRPVATAVALAVTLSGVAAASATSSSTPKKQPSGFYYVVSLVKSLASAPLANNRSSGQYPALTYDKGDKGNSEGKGVPEPVNYPVAVVPVSSFSGSSSSTTALVPYKKIAQRSDNQHTHNHASYPVARAGQANPTPPAHTGFSDMRLSKDVSVQVLPGSNGILPIKVSRELAVSQQGTPVPHSGETGELEMADLYHDYSHNKGQSYPVYLACYSQPGYEPSKGYLIRENFRVLGFVRVSGHYQGVKAIPDFLDDNDDPNFGRDISNQSHMYSNHCNNFLEACMSFDADGELVKNCWAGGETGVMRQALDQVHQSRDEVTWEAASNSKALVPVSR